MDPEPEHSIEPINDECSKLYYKTEQLLSEALNASLLSRQRHWMDTRLRTKLRAGGTRQHYQQFDYSTSETEEETHNEMLPIPTYSPQQIHTFTPNPILKQSPTHRHLTFYQMYRCSAVSRNCFPIMSQYAHLHHTFHSQVKLRSYPQWVPLLRC